MVRCDLTGCELSGAELENRQENLQAKLHEGFIESTGKQVLQAAVLNFLNLEKHEKSL